MKLRSSPISPYVRKVTATAIETGLIDRIDPIPTNVWDLKTDIVEQNPLGQVPTLITDDGEALYDSYVICEYLDSLHDGPKLIPAAGPERWTALRRHALATGINDSAHGWVLENMRPQDKRGQAWMDRQIDKINRGLDALEGEADALADGISIGHIAAGCALGYLDLRFEHIQWRAPRPKLAAWFAAFLERPCMAGSQPQDPKKPFQEGDFRYILKQD